jgi:hypothetical protein
MPWRFLVSVLVCCFWVAPVPVSADPIVISFSRVVRADVGLNGVSVTDINADADALFASASASEGENSVAAAAAFASQVRPDNQQFSGSARASASLTRSTDVRATSGALAVALLEFSIDQPYTYSFFGSFAPGADGFSAWDATLIGLTAPEIVFEYHDRSASVQTDTGLLLPGAYQFFVFGPAFADCAVMVPSACMRQEALTSFSFDLQLEEQSPAPVPEPGTMLFLTSGLSALVATRRRRAGRNP